MKASFFVFNEEEDPSGGGSEGDTEKDNLVFYEVYFVGNTIW